MLIQLAFCALALLVRQWEGHLACKNTDCVPAVMIRLEPCASDWHWVPVVITITSVILYAAIFIQNGLIFWYRLILEYQPLNERNNRTNTFQLCTSVSMSGSGGDWLFVIVYGLTARNTSVHSCKVSVLVFSYS